MNNSMFNPNLKLKYVVSAASGWRDKALETNISNFRFGLNVYIVLKRCGELEEKMEGFVNKIIQFCCSGSKSSSCTHFLHRICWGICAGFWGCCSLLIMGFEGFEGRTITNITNLIERK